MNAHRTDTRWTRGEPRDSAPHRRPIAFLAIALLVGGMAVAPAAAQGRGDQAGETFEVSVRAIRATKSNNDISPQLRPIARQLQAQFKYTGFRQISEKSGRVPANREFTADLGSGYTAKVTPISRQGRRVQLRIEVTHRKGDKEARLLNTTITSDAGTFSLQGGWKLDGGEDVLIIATSAR